MGVFFCICGLACKLSVCRAFVYLFIYLKTRAVRARIHTHTYDTYIDTYMHTYTRTHTHTHTHTHKQGRYYKVAKAICGIERISMSLKRKECDTSREAARLPMRRRLPRSRRGAASLPHKKAHGSSGSMGGLLTATTLHPRFEALVNGVDKKAKKPQLRFGVDKENRLRITLGGCSSASPIQSFDEKLTAIVWMLAWNTTLSWPLTMVDKLQKDMQSTDSPGRGFFTLDEFLGKSHSTSVLHLVMQRDTVKGIAKIFAMIPVTAAEINVVDRIPATFEGPQQKKKAKRSRSESNDERRPQKWRIVNGRKRLWTRDSDDEHNKVLDIEEKIHAQQVCAVSRAPSVCAVKCPSRARLPLPHAYASDIAGAQVAQFANTIKTGARPPMLNPPPHSLPTLILYSAAAPPCSRSDTVRGCGQRMRGSP